MALKYWTNGAGTNVLSTAGNWDPAVIPGAGDTAVFTGKRSNAAANGVTWTTALPDKWLIAADYTGNHGSSGSPVSFAVGAGDTLDLLQINGSGKMFYSTGGATPNVITDTVINVPGKATDQINLAGKHTNIFLNRGRINVEATAIVVTSLRLAYSQSRLADVICDIAQGATLTGSVLTMIGGRLTCAAAIPTVYLLGGHAKCTQGSITTAYISAATLQYDSAAGVITAVDVFPAGLLDLAKTADTRTITTSRIWSGGTIDARCGSPDSIIFTNNPLLIGAGARVMTAGSTLSFTQHD